MSSCSGQQEEKPAIISEQKVLACMMRSRDFCSVAATHLKPSYFENPIRHNLAKISADYYKLYGSPITLAAVTSELSKLVKSGKVNAADVPVYAGEMKDVYASDISDAQYVLKELVTFIKRAEWRKLIEEAVKSYLPKGKFTEIEKVASEIAAISTSSQVEPMDYYSDAAIVERTKRREEEALRPTIGISTGIKRMDDTLAKGGWYPKELYVILAPPKRGKTMSMLYWANVATWAGFNAAYFSCEVSKEVIADRLDACNTETEIKQLQLLTNIKIVESALKAKKPTGKLFVYEYPTKVLTSGEIERQLKIAESKGVRIDIIFVDYGDIMRPMRHYDNPLKEEASIFEELRGIAGKFVIPVVTATQVNREGSDKEIIRGKNVSGTWEKIMVADYIISLSATEAELKDNIMKVHFAECRNTPSRTLKIKTAYGLGKFYKEYIGEVV